MENSSPTAMQKGVMMKINLKQLVFALFLILISCSGGLDGEALNKGKEYFSSRVLECRGKHYVQGFSITELDGFKYYVKPSELSEADRRNGIEWKGQIGFEARLYRKFERNGQWSEFVTWDNNYMFGFGPNGIKGPSVSAVKKDGKWHVGENPWGRESVMGRISESMQLPRINISCDQLPK